MVTRMSLLGDLVYPMPDGAAIDVRVATGFSDLSGANHAVMQSSPGRTDRKRQTDVPIIDAIDVLDVLMRFWDDRLIKL